VDQHNLGSKVLVVVASKMVNIPKCVELVVVHSGDTDIVCLLPEPAGPVSCSRSLADRRVSCRLVLIDFCRLQGQNMQKTHVCVCLDVK